jgi:hypothetical protein
MAHAGALSRVLLTFAILSLSCEMAFGTVTSCPPNVCPQGFECMGRLYGEANQGGPAYHGDLKVAFPSGFRLDVSYQQDAVACFGGGNTSCGDLRASDIPRGIYIIPGGSYYWAVLKPITFSQTIGDIKDGMPQPGQFEFGMHLYCGPAGFPGPGCNVHVDVCAKVLSPPS